MTHTKRRQFLIAASVLLAAPHAMAQQQSAKIPRIGFLGATSKRLFTDVLKDFDAALRKLGYAEGRTIIVEYKFEEKQERLPGLAAELVGSKVDLIVTWGTPGTRAAKQATSTIPIVMAAVGDPVRAGLVASLAHPGGNITGLTNLDVGLAAKRLELLKQVLPKLSLMAVLRNPTNPSGVLQYKDTQAAARTLGIEVQLIDVRDPKEIESAFPAMVKARAGALTVLADPLFFSQQKQIADLAMANRLPSIFAREQNAAAGGLMSYGPNLSDQFRQVATYVDKILKGAKPSDLPVEQPTKFDLVINLKTAKAIGITIPRSVLAWADAVIQ